MCPPKPMCTTIAIYISMLVSRATSYINGEPPHIKKGSCKHLKLQSLLVSPVVGSFINSMWNNGFIKIDTYQH